MEIPAAVSGRPVTPRGVHLHPNGLHDYWVQNAAYWQDLLAGMGISWCVALTASDNLRISGGAEALLEAGVVPIVRPDYELPRPWTFGEETEELANLYAGYGAPLVVQFANEPFDPREWKNGVVPPREEAWRLICQRWHEMAAQTVQRGAYPGFPDGPCYGENPFLRIGDDALHWQEGRAVYLGHHYGKGRPVDYPYDDVARYGDRPENQLTLTQYCEQLDDYCGDPQWNWVDTPLALMNAQRAAWADWDKTAVEDPVCWRGWEQVAAYSEIAFGFVVQMALTEGGWVPRDRAGDNPVDVRWPYTTPRMVAAKTLAMYEDGSPHFAICPWLLADGYMAGGDVGWPFDAWVTWAYADKYGPEKPVVQVLRDNPPGPPGGVGAAIERITAAQGRLDGALAALE